MVIQRLPNPTLPATPPPIGPNLRRAREACGLTLRDMAALVGIDPSLILRYEKEERLIDAITLWKFAAIYGVAIETLFSTP